jgi:type IV pilus assembly protein PilE
MKSLILGFSLVEIVIALLIISILSAISFPIYSQYITQQHRIEAEVTLEKLSAALEQYYTLHDTYKNATLTVLHFPEFIAKNNYQLSITASDTYFMLEAKPLAEQAKKDGLCSILTLNSLGERGILGYSQLNCWEF